MEGDEECGHTLQKSIDFTPFEPSAGPTGGEGEACPAPTISFTMTSLPRLRFAMVGAVSLDLQEVVWCGVTSVEADRRASIWVEGGP
jgi:hypothetical protein